MPPRGAVAHHHERVGDVADQVPIVRDQQDRPGIHRQRILEQVAAREVEVVGRLVKHEQVDRICHGDGKRQPGALAPGQLCHLAVSGIAGESEAAEHGAHIAARLDADRRCEFFYHRASRVHHLGEVLSECGHVHVAAAVHLAADHVQLTLQDAQQRGLARAIRSDNADLGATFDDQIDAGQHGLVPVGIADRSADEFHHDA